LNCNEKIFPETQFGGYDNHDGTIAFYLRVNALINPSDVVLDIGCGRGQYQDDPISFRRNLRILRGKVHKVIGLDLDVNAAGNPYIDEFLLMQDSSAQWPVADRTIDLILADWSLEHIPTPDHFFGEVHRVLKSGGYFCARTTNAWGYVALAARMIPEKYHTKIVQKVQIIRKEEDIFPTYYACNSVPLLRKQLNQYGFTGVVYGFEGVPGYLNFSCFLYYLGYLYERFFPHYFRNTLMVFAKKAS